MYGSMEVECIYGIDQKYMVIDLSLFYNMM